MKTGKTIMSAGLVAILFGIATLLSGGKALFGGDEARAAVGHAVPFILWFNFLAGFLYVLGGVGILMKKDWGARVALFLLIATAIVFAAFGFHVWGGGAYETRTVAAMTFRTLFWAFVSFISIRYARQAALRRERGEAVPTKSGDGNA